MSDQDALRREDDRLIGILIGEFKTFKESIGHEIRDIKTDIGDVKGSIKWQNGRVRRLEGWRWLVLGAWASTCIFGYMIWDIIRTPELLGRIVK